MKKTSEPKHLALRAETIRALRDARLADAAGGRINLTSIAQKDNCPTLAC